jgi:hypothetical protein
VGRVWSETGTQLAQATYAHESASGWQRQALAEPLTLEPGRVYTLSVGLNDYYVKTLDGLATPLQSGPLSSVATSNGRYAEVAGQYPTSSWRSSNYFVDGVVRLPDAPARTPDVVSTTPLASATGVPTGSTVTATFAVPLDASTLNADTFTLEDAAGDPVAGSVAYDDATLTATFVPAAQLETGGSYTARLTTGIRSDDETPLAAPVAWSFATVPPEPPTVTGSSPAGGGTQVSPYSPVSVTFSEAMDEASLAGAFDLSGPGGSHVPFGLSYDAPSRTATLAPTGPLAASSTYELTVGTAARSARGVALAAPDSRTFTTSGCPCRLFAGEPAFDWTGLDTRNWRSGTGPWSLELGVKIEVTQAARLEAVRYYRDPAETGTHSARVWTAAGALLATVPFTGESGSGWQEQQLGAPLALTPGATYVVSVGMNSAFGMEDMAFADPVVSGPLRSIAGPNGVYGDSAGTFPSQSWRSSNYGVDAVVR